MAGTERKGYFATAILREKVVEQLIPACLTRTSVVSLSIAVWLEIICFYIYCQNLLKEWDRSVVDNVFV